MSDDGGNARARARLGTTVREKYLLDHVLGIGGMATVYAATHRNKKRFALKMLHTELSQNDEIRKRFQREGYVANSVGHPGAVAVLDDDVAEDGSAFIVMELLEGDVVENMAERHGKLTPAVVLAIAHELLDILGAAHAKNIIHRDVKPANVFLTTSGQLKVLDFGIARMREGQSERSRTQTGVAMGTPAFMAPEQALGRTNLIDAQTDVWAVGAMMFSLLSQRFVHEADTLQELMVYAATKPARALRSATPDVPEDVGRIVDKALAFEKAERWASATEMQSALRTVYQSLFSDSIPAALATFMGAQPALARTEPPPRHDPAADNVETGPATAPLVRSASPATKLSDPTLRGAGPSSAAAREVATQVSTASSRVAQKSAPRLVIGIVAGVAAVGGLVAWSMTRSAPPQVSELATSDSAAGGHTATGAARDIPGHVAPGIAVSIAPPVAEGSSATPPQPDTQAADAALPLAPKPPAPTPARSAVTRRPPIAMPPSSPATRAVTAPPAAGPTKSVYDP